MKNLKIIKNVEIMEIKIQHISKYVLQKIVINMKKFEEI